MLDVGLRIVDGSVFSEGGYVGEEVERMLWGVLEVGDYDVGGDLWGGD